MLSTTQTTEASYFSTINILEDIGATVVPFQPKVESKFSIDVELLAETIRKEHPHAIFLTNPFFGSGQEYDLELISRISKIAAEANVWLIMDYVYGGMQWGAPLHDLIFNQPVFDEVKKAGKYVFIESISKKVFLNGAKTSLIFSTNSLISSIEDCSLYTTGSMCCLQVEMFKKLYQKENVYSIGKTIKTHTAQAEKSYRITRSLLLNSTCKLMQCSCGYFTLASLPKNEKQSDILIAQEILRERGVLTIPHSRYLLESPNKYIFRINLLESRENLTIGVNQIASLSQYL